MSKELIERLLDNRVTGFNLTVAAVEAANLIEAQAAQIEVMREALESLSALGIMAVHNGTPRWVFPIKVLDRVNEALATTPNEALQAFAEKVREQCVMECEKIIGGKVKNEQWWYGFRAGVSQSISVINKLKELPK